MVSINAADLSEIYLQTNGVRRELSQIVYQDGSDRRTVYYRGDNVLEDPSFEMDYWFDNWPSSWFPAAPTSVARTGDQAAAITRAQSTLATTFNLGTVDVEVGDSWRFVLWYRAAEGDHPNLDYGVGTQIRIRDAADNSILDASPTFMVSEEWNRAVLTVTVPDGVSSLHASLTPSHTTGTLIIDDMAFQQVWPGIDH